MWWRSRSEVGGQKKEVGDQRSEVRRQSHGLTRMGLGAAENCFTREQARGGRGFGVSRASSCRTSSPTVKPVGVVCSEIASPVVRVVVCGGGLVRARAAGRESPLVAAGGRCQSCGSMPPVTSHGRGGVRRCLCANVVTYCGAATYGNMIRARGSRSSCANRALPRRHVPD
jgi:hypothetical protein